MEGGGLRFTVLTYGYDNATHYCSFNELDLKDRSDPDVVAFKGNPREDIPIHPGFFRANGALFMAGGLVSKKDDIFKFPKPTKCLWSALPRLSTVAGAETWTLCPAAMNIERCNPTLVQLRDGKVFICGGTAELECWAELYDPVKGVFGARILSDAIGYPYPSSCFQWTDQEVMIYYHDWVYDKQEFYHPSLCALVGEDKEHKKPSLVLYNMVEKTWNVFAENLPDPLYQMNKRNLVYVGGDILFIIDYATCWFVYDLSSKKEVGRVKVEIECESEDNGEVVLGAFYAGANNVTSWVFYLFLHNTLDSHNTLRYAKVEVVQAKGGDYVATLQMSGVLGVGLFTDIYIIADSASHKRAAEEDLSEGKGKGKEKMMRSE